MTKNTEIASKEELVSEDRPSWMVVDSKQRGNEEVTNDDITLPRLQIVQDLSPQHKKSKPEYIEGAEVGDFFNSVSQKLFKASIKIIPIHFKVEFVIWKDQKAGGGFFGAFDTELEAKRALPSVVEEGGGNAAEYEVVLTNVHFILIMHEGSTPEAPILEQAVISMAKSQNKVSRNFNSMVKMAGGDRFSRVYDITTVDDKNKAGQEYKNWRLKPKGWVSEMVYKYAEATYDTIKAGERKVNYSEDNAKAAPASKSNQPDDGDMEDEFAV